MASVDKRPKVCDAVASHQTPPTPDITNAGNLLNLTHTTPGAGPSCASVGFPITSVLRARRMLEMDREYAKEYSDFIASMVYGRDPPPPSLPEALTRIDEIIADIGR